MKKQPFRSLFGFGLLAAASLISGCAQMIDVLNATANELERERCAQEYYAYYALRPSSDTSAPGIK